MITKTLRTSGGDYSSLTDLFTYLRTTVRAGMTDSITVNVEKGATFGSDPNTLYSVQDDDGTPLIWTTNNYTITFQPDPADISSNITTLIGGFRFIGDNNIAMTGFINIYFWNFKVIGGSFSAQFTGSTSTHYISIHLRNCIIHRKFTQSCLFISNDNGNNNNYGLPTVYNCTYFITSELESFDIDLFGYDGYVDPIKIRNTNVVIAYAANSNLRVYGTAGYHDIDYVSVYKVSGGNMTIFPGSTISHYSTTNPNLTDNVVQSNTDSVTTTASRNPYPTVNSTSLIGQADAVTLLSTDIVGLSRPQGAAGDIGAYEWVNLVVIPDPPVLSSPANNAIDQHISLTLDWAESVGADSYGLQVATSSGFGTLLVNTSGLVTTSIDVSGLSYGTDYFWRANATNSAGTSAWASGYKFTTDNLPAITFSSISQRATRLVDVTYVGVDAESNSCNLVVYEFSQSPFLTWSSMTPKTDDASHSGVSGVTFLPTSGSILNFVWNIDTDIPSFYYGPIKVRLQAYDGTASGNLSTSAGIYLQAHIASQEAQKFEKHNIELWNGKISNDRTSSAANILQKQLQAQVNKNKLEQQQKASNLNKKWKRR